MFDPFVRLQQLLEGGTRDQHAIADPDDRDLACVRRLVGRRAAYAEQSAGFVY